MTDTEFQIQSGTKKLHARLELMSQNFLITFSLGNPERMIWDTPMEQYLRQEVRNTTSAVAILDIDNYKRSLKSLKVVKDYLRVIPGKQAKNDSEYPILFLAIFRRNEPTETFRRISSYIRGIPNIDTVPTYYYKINLGSNPDLLNITHITYQLISFGSVSKLLEICFSCKKKRHDIGIVYNYPVCTSCQEKNIDRSKLEEYGEYWEDHSSK